MNKEKVLEYFLKCSLSEEKVFEVVLLTGDASTRQYYRIETARQNYIVCLQDKAEKAKLKDFVEVHKVLQGQGVDVPTIHDYDMDAGCFVLEDLGDTTLLSKLAYVNDDEKELDFYKMAIGQLLKIHSVDGKKYKYPMFQRAFDLNKLMEEVDFTLKHLITGLMSYSLKKEERKVLLSSYENICEKISQEERVLSHRDFHSRNLMYHKKSFFIIDFQDAMMGVPQYDLASLLDDCYYNISLDNKAFLKKYYFDLSPVQWGDFKCFLELYDYVEMQRLFKALGSFGYIYQSKNDIRYLKYVGHGFEKLREVLKKYPKFDELRVLLSKIYYEG